MPSKSPGKISSASDLPEESLEAITERLAKLEKTSEDSSMFSSPPENDDTSLTTTLSVSPQARSADSTRVAAKRKYQASTTYESSTSGHQDSKRKMSLNIDSKAHNERNSPDATRHASEAREFIEHELQCNPTLSQDRRTTLELAQRFVGQLSNPRIHGQKSNTAEHLGVADNLGPPVLTPELLYMMLPGTDKRTNSQGTYVWPDHITDKTLERMGLAIIERSEGEPVLHLYRISVWVKALSCISKMAPLISSAPLRVHFRALKKQYEAAANEELDSISLTAVPSLPLLQALLSGKRLMQYLGNMSRSWMFNALASRIIVALNYHNITDPVPHNETEEEIHACLYTCYYFDKTLSVLLLRPPSLPDLKVDPTQLIHMDPDLPTTPIIRGIVEFAHIKSTLVNILLDSNKMGDMDKANVLSNLVARAHAVHSDLEIHRSRQEQRFSTSWGTIQREWLSMDFNYYSVLTTIIRARSSVLKSRLVCEECLFTARKALTTLRAMQEAFSGHATSVDSYPSFLTWYTFHLALRRRMKLTGLGRCYYTRYLLSSFFFATLLQHRIKRDFEMIKKITDDLRQFAKANAPIGKLYGLFSKFLDLCTPLIKGNTGLTSSSVTISSLSNDPSNLNIVMFGRADRAIDTLPSPVTTTSKAPTAGISQSMEGWDDSLMWELFDNQPSLGWAESELWDAMTQLSS
ncbi:hypothetical protein N7533_001199 [Penicillium manginii]|uniref:uncharacterized protein n=1 Tax=Penicillium manginii TaxID=203109 RepID=UPI0025466735|nr:uncharacterized protein N7533_001199 [Penicillium manginii]KAJ5768616.1 hypothetical protein N7533_001199 [Penicillium manginii]